MRKLLLAAALFASVLIGAAGGGIEAQAQNVICADRPPGDNTYACVNTRFVHGLVAGLPTLAGNNTWTGSNTFNGPLKFNQSFVNTYADASIGSDANDCLAATVGGGHGPCLTPQAAVNAAYQSYAGGGSNSPLTINLNGAFTSGVNLFNPAPGLGSNYLYVTIAGSGHASTSITVTSALACCQGGAVVTSNAVNAQISGMTISDTVSGSSDIFVQSNSQLVISSDIVLGTADQQLVHVEGGSLVYQFGAMTISGSAQYVYGLTQNSIVQFANAITCSGTPNYTAIILAQDNSTFYVFSNLAAFNSCGSITGAQYALTGNSILDNTTSISIPGAAGSNTISANSVYQTGSTSVTRLATSVLAPVTITQNGSFPIVNIQRSDLIASGTHGEIIFFGLNSSSVSTPYSAILSFIQSNAAGSENGALIFQTRQSGVQTQEGVFNGGFGVGSSGNRNGVGTATIDLSATIGTTGGGGAATGAVNLLGATSGNVTIKPQAAAGTYNFNLPTTAGSSGQPLLSAGGGSSPMTFGTLGVGGGGTGLTSGTSGGILGFTGTTTLASSVLLTQNALILGGGAGATPTPLGSLGTTTTVLHGNAAGAPSFAAVVSADMNITTTSCTNQFVTAISSGGVGTCTTDTLASAQHANQGTTTTVLHGNAAGNPSWAAVSLTADVSGILAGTNGGTGVNNGASTITVAGNFAVTTNGGTISFGAASKTLTVNNSIGLSGTDGKTLTVSNSGTLSGGDGFTLSIAASKTLTASNSLTLAGTDGKSLTLTNGLTVNTNDGTLAFGAASKTLTVNNSLTLAGTDSTTMTFPATSTTVAGLSIANTFTAAQTISVGAVNPLVVTANSSQFTNFNCTNVNSCTTGFSFSAKDAGGTSQNFYVVANSGTNLQFQTQAAGIIVFGKDNGGGGFTEQMRVLNSGGVAIGNTTDASAGGLDINGQLYMPNITQTSAAQTATVCWSSGSSPAGKFTVDTTVGCLTSLEEAKNILSYLSPSEALDLVMELRPFSFRFRPGYGDGGQYEQFGLGAHAVGRVDERMVGRDFEGNLHGVRYKELTAVLAGAIKALKADNDNLRARVGVLEARAAANDNHQPILRVNE